MASTEDKHRIATIERYAAQALPPLYQQAQQGWLLRYNAGITRRANAVFADLVTPWPIETAQLEPHVRRVETFYRRWGRPAYFQLAPNSQPDTLDAFLEQRGYGYEAGAQVHTARLEALLTTAQTQAIGLVVQMQETFSEDWWRLYEAVEHPDGVGSSLRRLGLERLVRLGLREDRPQQVRFVSAYAAHVLLAVAVAVRQDAYVGLFNLASHPQQRRRGAARAIIGQIANWGKQAGASQCYLQVAPDNHQALALYQRLGFSPCYSYHYRRQTR